MKKLSCFLVLALLAGCSHNPGTNPDQVEISGTVTQSGRPVSDVVLNLQVTGSGTPATFPVTNGAFKGKATPGKYTYFISEGRNLASMKSIPQKYHAGSLDRQLEVNSGKSLTISLD